MISSDASERIGWSEHAEVQHVMLEHKHNDVLSLFFSVGIFWSSEIIHN